MSAIGQTGTIAATPSADPSGLPPGTGQATTDPTQQQGQPQQTTKPDGFWGRFPNIPEDQRPALEPHLKSIQGYITRIEQAYVAPFKDYTPTQVKGLAAFAKAFDTSPLQTFLQVAASLQKTGVIHDNLDLQALAAVVQGQDPPEDDEPVVPGADGGVDPWAEAPQWAQELRAESEQRKQAEVQQQQANAEQRENAVLDHQIAQAKAKLKGAGFPDNLLPDDKELIARFIVHNGSLEAVVQGLSGLRTGILQGVMPTNGQQNGNVDLPRGVPPTGRSSLERRAAKNPGDAFAKASAGAEQFIRKANRG